MGLWYPTSMGPTRDGTRSSNSCVFCRPPDGQAVVGSFCCADTADYRLYNELGTRAGGEIVQVPR